MLKFVFEVSIIFWWFGSGLLIDLNVLWFIIKVWFVDNFLICFKLFGRC